MTQRQAEISPSGPTQAQTFQEPSSQLFRTADCRGPLCHCQVRFHSHGRRVRLACLGIYNCHDQHDCDRHDGHNFY